MYVKLFGSIVDSSIWDEDIATRLVWITLLVTADETGFVRTTDTALARRANVPYEDCLRALEVLKAPDPRSRSEKEGGRRIRTEDGGFFLINYADYREIRTKKQLQDAERQRRYRASKPKEDEE